MIYLVAMNPADARRCARSHGLSPKSWRYLSASSQLLGVYRATVWLVYGWEYRTNAEELMRQMDERELTFINKPLEKGGKFGPVKVHGAVGSSHGKRVVAERSRTRSRDVRTVFNHDLD